jgi:hypothetical protein
MAFYSRDASLISPNLVWAVSACQLSSLSMIYVRQQDGRVAAIRHNLLQYSLQALFQIFQAGNVFRYAAGQVDGSMV